MSRNEPIAEPAATFLGGYTGKSGVPVTELDRQQIDELIREASKGSKFYQYQQRREVRITSKVELLRQKKASFDAAAIRKAKSDVKKLLEEVEMKRDLTRTFLHIDMDAFFAAVEILKRPELESQPVAVGGESMLSTANYEARKYGVVSAMPGYIARKLCPHLTILPCDYEAYRKSSAEVHSILQEYDPNSSSYSLDEASVDLTEYLRGTAKSAEEVVSELRERVFAKTRLTCSAGIAPNRQLAKMCSNINKPNGQFRLLPDAKIILESIGQQKVSKISGVGKVTSKILFDLLGIVKCADIIREAHWIKLLFSEIQSDFLLLAAMGAGMAFGEGGNGEGERKSLSVERTFKTMDALPEMLDLLKWLCEQLAEDLAAEELVGRNLGIKMKTSEFDVFTRVVTLDSYVGSSKEIYRHAEKLLIKNRPTNLRLLGVRMAGLCHVDEVAMPRYRMLDEFVSVAEIQRPNCPICGCAIDAHPDDNLRINEHIDRCLPTERPPKRKPAVTLDGFFNKRIP
jgi:DNA polymerase kappa